MSIDSDGLSTDKPGGITGKKHRHVGDVCRADETAHRRTSNVRRTNRIYPYTFCRGLPFYYLVKTMALDPARTNGVGPDIEWAEFIRKSLH